RVGPAPVRPFDDGQRSARAARIESRSQNRQAPTREARIEEGARPRDAGEGRAAAVSRDPSETESSQTRSNGLEAPEAPQRFVDAVVHALRDRDFEALDRAIERGEAEGADLGAIGRVRALGELARGDLESARKRL